MQKDASPLVSTPKVWVVTKSLKCDNGQLILTPYAEVPYSEKWIFEDPDLLEKFKQQIAQKKAD